MKTAIIVPCYNEERRLLTKLFSAAIVVDPEVDFLFVDDGSTDGTRAMLKALCGASGGRMSLLQLDGNRGKADAVRQGALAALTV